MPRSGRTSLVPCTVGLWALASAVAQAGPADPSHRFESVGISKPGASELLEVPGSNRLLVFLRTGEVHAVTGGGMADALVATVPVDAGCAEGGLLHAAWDPEGAGSTAFVAYVAQRNGALAVGRIDVATGSFTEIFNHGVAAPCANVGGGLAALPDGTLLLGIGDMGQPVRAGSGTSNMGKIYRMTREGAAPASPLVENPLGAGSYMAAFGVRNPVAIAVDPSNGEAWFLDQGPGSEDELNLLVPGATYGWSTGLLMGPLEIPGFEDPYYTWPGTGMTGLAVDRQGRLGGGPGSLLVASLGGDVASVLPDRADRLASLLTPLFTRDATGPQSFLALRLLPSGHPHVLDDAGGVHRLRPAMGQPFEPSAPGSIVPVALRKGAGGLVEIASERVPGATETGLHVGAIAALRATGYDHDDVAPSYSAVSPETGDAWTRLTVPADSLRGAGASAYVLVSARRDCSESGLGEGTLGDRPIAATGCAVDVLGGGTHDVADVEITTVIDATAPLNLPRDLAFHPDVPGELWVVNVDDSAVIIHDTGLPTQWTTRHAGDGNYHFFAQPSALAFGPGTGFLASIHEEDDYTQGPPPGGTPRDFMGPTLWTDDSAEFEGGHASHYDMLHDSPNGMGIAWETRNVYWVYDGYHLSLTRYDFGLDHGPGGADHSDAIVRRYVQGEVGYEPGISSHVQFDPATGLVYAADTANSRIVVLDPATGTDGGAISPNYDGCSQRAVAGATLTTFVDGASVGMIAPSGLELWNGLLYVSDNATSRILAFDMAGTLVDWLDTGFPAGTLMGMSFDPADGSLCVVDVLGPRVLRIRPR